MGEQPHSEDRPTRRGAIVVRYWASARAASGVESEVVETDSEITLARVIGEVLERHDDRPRLREVVAVCSVLIGDRPVGTTDPAKVVVRPGDTVELLPPFAGG